ncbi:MAG: hypothetical protein KJ604_20435, partial [Gammaproteobacteria bacterium]|nr:hypothetical protein [Gammaproteobacteria bacterium]
DKYEEAPGKEIQDIFRVKSKKLSNADSKWISEFLQSLSDEHEEIRFNSSRLFDQAKRHFKIQRLRTAVEEISEYLDEDKLEEAEEILNSTIKTTADVTDLGVSPTDISLISKIFEIEREDGSNISLGMGDFDKLAGPQKPHWLVMFMAPMKRGKTRTLTHLAVWAARKGVNTVFISLESEWPDLVKTIWMAMKSLTTERNGEVLAPYFSKRGKLVDGNKERFVKQRTIKRPTIYNEEAVFQAVKAFNLMSKGRLQIKTFPAYSAGIKEIDHYLDSLEVFENLQPELIIVDYLGAMKKPQGAFGRDAYDENSKGLKGMAQRRKALVATAHQGTRKTLEKMNLDPDDVPEDIRILGNVDALYGIMQTDAEKELGVMRFNVIVHRWKKFSRGVQAKVLTSPEMGQLYLDSEIIRSPKSIINKSRKVDQPDAPDVNKGGNEDE